MVERRSLHAALRALVGTTRAQGAMDLKGTTVVFASWGGAYQDAEKVSYCEPFAKATGATVVQDGPMNVAKFRAMASSGTPDWDVVDITGGFLEVAARDGLLEKIDPKLVTLSRIEPRFVHEYGVGCIVWSYNLGYSTTAFPNGAPTTWADLFDLKKFPGKRTVLDQPVASLEVALLADGVAPDKLYPLDVDRAFKKLEEIKPNITVWWTSGAQSAQLLNDGEVDMVMAWNGRVSALVNEGAKVGFTYNQGLLQSTSLCILKNAPNLPTAVRFLNEAVDPVNQANLPLHIDYGPANPKAFDTGVIKPERVAQLPSAPDNARKQALMSYAWWSSPAGEAAEKRWVSFMQK